MPIFTSTFQHPALGNVQLKEYKQMAKKAGKTRKRKAEAFSGRIGLLTNLFYLYLLPLNGMREGCEDRENSVEIKLKQEL